MQDTDLTKVCQYIVLCRWVRHTDQLQRWLLDKVNVHDALSITQVNEACNLRSRCYLHLRQSAATVHKRPCGDRGKGARSCRANGQIIHSTIAVLSLQDIVHYHHSVISSKKDPMPWPTNFHFKNAISKILQSASGYYAVEALRIEGDIQSTPYAR